MNGRVLCLVILAVLSFCKASMITLEEDANFHSGIRTVNRNINDNIMNALINLQTNMSVGFPQFGIPPLDPLHIEEISFVINQPKLKLGAIFNNLHVEHLSEFVVDKVKASMLMLKMDLAISLPLLEASGEYKLEGIISNFLSIFGEGHFEVALKGNKLSGGVELSVKNNYVSIRTLTLDFSFAKIDAKIENFWGGGDLSDTANYIINKLGPFIFNEVKPFILDMATNKLISLANEQLANVTLHDIMGMLGMRSLRALHAEMGLL